MRHNITDSRYLKGFLTFDKSAVGALINEHDGELAEVNFLQYERTCHEEVPDNPDVVKIKNLWWYGEFSGHYFDVLKKILSKSKGKAQVIFVWEGGDKHTILDIDDGVVKQKKAKITAEE